jgi:hypothetical protein
VKGPAVKVVLVVKTGLVVLMAPIVLMGLVPRIDCAQKGVHRTMTGRAAKVAPVVKMVLVVRTGRVLRIELAQKVVSIQRTGRALRAALTTKIDKTNRRIPAALNGPRVSRRHQTVARRPVVNELNDRTSKVMRNFYAEQP